MAARKRLFQLPRTREKIRASILRNRSQNHVLGKCEMMPSQVSAAVTVLRKLLPDLMAVEVQADTSEIFIDAVRASSRYAGSQTVKKALFRDTSTLR